MSTTIRVAASAIVGVTTLAVLAGCSSSGSGGGSSASAKTASSPSQPSTLTAASVKVLAEASGGRANVAAKGAPIKIGIITNDGVGGADAKPSQNAESSAVKVINQKLGGVQGRPIQTVRCTITTSAAQGTACAQQMLNDKSIVAVVEEQVNTGNSQVEGTIHGQKPIFTTTAGPTNGATPNLYAFNGGVLSANGVLSYVSEELHAKSVSIVTVQAPYVDQILSQWTSTLKSLGVTKVTKASLPATATDATSAIAASGAATSDAVIVASLATTSCAPFMRGMGNVKGAVVTLGICADPSVQKALGGHLPNWTYFYPYKNTAAPDPTGQAAAYNQAVAEYGDTSLATTNQVPVVFQTIIGMAGILNDVPGPLTTSAVKIAATKWTGPVFLGPDQVRFGVKPFPDIAETGGLAYMYKDGKWSTSSPLKWLR